MNFYPEGYSVVLTVLFTDKEGTAIVPTAVTARLLDGAGLVVNDFGAITFDGPSGQASITVPALYNTLEDGEARAVRQLEVTLETAGTRIVHDLTYAVEAEQSLVLLVNTFQTLAAAELLSLDHVNTSGWSAADETRQRAALVEAYRRITAIPMRYGVRDVDGRLDPEAMHIIDRDEWGGITSDAFQAFPSHFKRQLRLAQFLEANELLQGDQVLARHRAGVIQETIGESSVKLAAARLDMGLSVPALHALAGYINYDFKVRRS